MSPSFFYEQGLRKLSEPLPVPARFIRISVKRRTWRTLWLVKRTDRVKVPVYNVSLSNESYTP